VDFYKILLFSFVLTINGCSFTTTSEFKSGSKIPEGQGLVFGVFQQKGEMGEIAITFENTLDDPRPFKQYQIVLSKGDPVVVITADPGKYRIIEINYYLERRLDFPSVNNKVLLERDLKQDQKYLIRPFVVEKNKVLYLGDFTGTTELDEPEKKANERIIGYVPKGVKFTLKHVKDNYDTAVELLSAKFPELSSLEKIKAPYLLEVQ